jgi:prepilin-type N-terminal cleavage/methylation domain-containing protein
MSSQKAFTLIELLVVIAIIAILAVVVVLTLNPAALLQQSRDSQRLSDMSTLNDALGIFSANNTNSSAWGSASTTYVSIPDPLATSTLGDQCQGLNLPALSSGDTYQCPASSNSRNTDGTGWIPVDFNSLPTGSPVGTLPVDPTNQSSSGLFYTYTTDGTNYEVTSILESQKYKAQYAASPQTPLFPEVLTQGTNLSLSELFNPNGLVGYWPLNEGSGSTANDLSGNGNNGTWSGTQAGSSGYYSGGKVGAWAGYFNGSNDYIAITSNLNSYTAITIAAWIAPATTGYMHYFTGDGAYLASSAGGIMFAINGWGIGYLTTSAALKTGWNYVVATWNGVTGTIYINGVSVGSSPASGTGSATGDNKIGSCTGCGTFFQGTIDDVRVYNRAFSPAEIQALYNAEK